MTTPPPPPSGIPMPTISAEKIVFTVAPGGSVEVSFTLANPSAAAEFFQIAVLGVPPSWVAASEPSMRF